MTVLLREAIGDRLRHARTTQRRTLREVSRAARVSLGYLSEVERGRKEASSELLASICDALELPLAHLLHLVAADIGALSSVDKVGEPAERREPAAAGGTVEAGRIVPAVVGDDLSDLRLQPALTHRLSAPITDSLGGVVVAA